MDGALRLLFPKGPWNYQNRATSRTRENSSPTARPMLNPRQGTHSHGGPAPAVPSGRVLIRAVVNSSAIGLHGACAGPAAGVPETFVNRQACRPVPVRRQMLQGKDWREHQRIPVRHSVPSGYEQPSAWPRQCANEPAGAVRMLVVSTETKWRL